MKAIRTAIVVATLLTASCGKPNVSGIYVGKEDRAVLFVQLIQDKDDKVSGRIELATIGNDGEMTRNETSETGSVSGNDIILQPVSFWSGGVATSGKSEGDRLTLFRDGNTVTATRSTLADYQRALADLNQKAFRIQRDIAIRRAQQNAATDAARRMRAITGANNRLASLASNLRLDTVKLKGALAKIPDFGSQAAANTDRIARMARTSPSLSSEARVQLKIEANQVEVATKQIEVERSQYAISLNGIGQDGGEAISEIDRICDVQSVPEVAAACSDARRAKNDFKAMIAHGRDIFLPYKAKLQSEMRRQAQFVARIG